MYITILVKEQLKYNSILMSEFDCSQTSRIQIYRWDV